MRSGCRSLSPREAEICQLASTGMTNKQIALVCGIRHPTVDAYWQRIFHKLDAHGRTHAVALTLNGGAQPAL